MGVDVDARNEYGQTAVYVASMHGHTEAVRMLRGWVGARIDQRANGNSTCLCVAAANGHADTVAALIEGGADPRERGAEGKSALDLVRERGQAGVLAVLRRALGGGESDSRCVAQDGVRCAVTLSDPSVPRVSCCSSPHLHGKALRVA